MLDSLHQFGLSLLGPYVWPVVWILLGIVCILVPLILSVAYLTFWERKLIGAMHLRKGPNRVGPGGMLQAFADVIKLLLKEVITPAQANKVLYIVAPMVVLMPAFAAWAVIPFGPETVLANVNAGLLYVMAITSVGVYGVIVAGWRRTPSMPSSARCVRRPRWCPTSSRSVSSSSPCCWSPAA